MRPNTKRIRTFLVTRYQVKVAFFYLSVIVLILFLFNTYPIREFQMFVFRSKESSLSARAGLISKTLSGLDILTPDNVQKTLGNLGDRSFSRMMVTDPDGLVLFDDSATSVSTGKYALFPEILRSLSGSDVFACTFSNNTFESHMAIPIMNHGRVIGSVYLLELDTDQARLLSSIQKNIAGISAGLAIVVIVLSIFASTALSRRIGDLLRGIRLVREGEYSHRVPKRGRDEIADLADEFNELTGRLQKTEALRRQFVSDASHELKTPLASIRLLTDSILQTRDMNEALIREFVSDIGDESDRLTRMTEKLLALTKLDAEIDLPVSAIDMEIIVSRVIRRLTPLAQHCGITLESSMDKDCFVETNEDDMFQILFNLVENAIKYNRPNGIVRILLFIRSQQVNLIVQDTGIGIPEEEIPHIFDRFYRVDKARSREAGGAGLGLSIVKNTVTRYRGTIELDSELGQGTRISIFFPLAESEGGTPA